MSKQPSLPLIQEVEGGYTGQSGSLTVRDLKAILETQPDDMPIMVRYPSKDFSVEHCSPLSWAVKDHLLFSDEDDPRYGLYLQPLKPSAVQRNREFYKNQGSNPRT